MTSTPSATLYDRIAADVLRRVVAGELRPGDRLAPVRQAAREWGVNLNTVARAYALLAGRGILETRAGGGTVVAATRPDATRWGADPVAEARAERLRSTLGGPILVALGLGYSPAEIEAVVSTQLARWRPGQPSAPSSPGSAAASESARPGDVAIPGATIPGAATPGAVASSAVVRFVGSHDLSLELLAARLRGQYENGEPPLTIVASGSLEGLFALAHGTADLAGCHLRDPDSGDDNLPFVRRVLPGEQLLLVTLAHREQGLLVAPGNPKSIRTIADLARADVTFVNRQRGAGTRVLLDELLAEAGIGSSAVRGHDREEATHLAVAGVVASGAADVALGIRAAARAFGLDFVALTRERYELVVRPETAERPTIRALLGVLADPDFHAAVRSLGGYDTTDTGTVRRT